MLNEVNEGAETFMGLEKGGDGQEHAVSCSEISGSILSLWCKRLTLNHLLASCLLCYTDVHMYPDRHWLQALHVSKVCTSPPRLLHGRIAEGHRTRCLKWQNSSSWCQNKNGEGEDRHQAYWEGSSRKNKPETAVLFYDHKVTQQKSLCCFITI